MKRNILTFAFILLASAILAQTTGTIRGFLYDKKTGEPILFGTVALKGTKFGTNSDATGLFVLSKVPPGTYTLVGSNIGFDTLVQTINLKAGEIKTLRLEIAPKGVEMGGVSINADAEKKAERVNISVETITSRQISKIASVGGEPDIAQYLQILPGVVFTGDQGGQLYIRGGAPIQNKVLLDGMVIYNPFHSIGLFSVFETDIIRTADVLSAGFNAQYGGRVSAVMDVNTRDGNQKFHKQKISVSPFASKLIMEGPLGKSTDSKLAPTYLVSGKTSYLDKTSPILYSYADTNGLGLPFSFNDIYGKVSFNSRGGSKLNLFGFNFDDRVQYPNATNIGWKNRGAGANFILVPEGSPTIIRGNAAFSDYLISQNEADGLPRSSKISSFNSGLNFSYFLGKDELNYGFDILNMQTDFRFTNQANRTIYDTKYSTELSGFAKYRIVKPKLVIEPGVRLQYYASIRETSVEPRIGMKWNISKKVRFKAASGLYSQNLFSASSDKDVVNLFYGFLSSPSFEDIPKNFNGSPVTSKLQKAAHLVAGIEWDPHPNLEINSEAFIKRFGQIININRNKIFESGGNTPDLFTKDFIVENGDAYGWDFRAKYEKKQLYLWFVYSLTYVNRYDGIRKYAPVFDRRHNINLVATYMFGKGKLWEASARFNYGSGFPFTQTQAFYEKTPLDDKGIGTNFLGSNGSLGILYAEFNAGRLPDYHRMDLSVKKSMPVFKDADFDVTFSVSNAYNRANIFYFDRVNYRRVNQLPVLPSLAMSLTF